eukprot:3793749-Rhodomonas_salina.1
MVLVLDTAGGLYSDPNVLQSLNSIQVCSGFNALPVLFVLRARWFGVDLAVFGFVVLRRWMGVERKDALWT